MLPWQPLVAAVPELGMSREQTGIGRVLHNLCALWGDRVRAIDATFRSYPLPVLRNIPYAVRPHGPAHLVLLPRLTGAQALRGVTALPSLVIVHDIGIVDFSGDREEIGWLTRQSILRSFRGLRHATRIVAVSRFTRDRLVAYCAADEGQITVAPNGVSATFLGHHRGREESRRRVEHRLGGPIGGPLLLNVGSEIARKNMPLLLRSFAAIKEHHPTARLIKVGKPGHPGARARTLRLCGELGLRPGSDVLILEDVGDALLADLYHTADVFVSASLYEGFGLPALESLAVGTPVVVTDRGAYPEIVGEVGRVATPDPRGLTRAILAALTDPNRDERSRAGRAHAAAYTWSRTADAYLAVMGEVCDRAAARATAPSRAIA